MRLFAASGKLTKILLTNRMAVSPIKPPREISEFSVRKAHAGTVRRPDAEKLRGNLHRNQFVRRNIGCKAGARTLGNGFENIITARFHHRKHALLQRQQHLRLYAGNRISMSLPTNDGKTQVRLAERQYGRNAAPETLRLHVRHLLSPRGKTQTAPMTPRRQVSASRVK